MISLEEIGTRARGAEPVLRIMGTETKNRVLKKAAENLVADADAIIAANALDMEHGREKGMSKGVLDRLFLDQSRIEAMVEGLCQVSELDDPIGEVLGMKKRPNGLLIGQKRVPLGVVGIIYEARPNVTADAFALCFKTGNVVILKGGSDAIHSNMAIVASLRKTLKEEQVPEDALLLIVADKVFPEIGGDGRDGARAAEEPPAAHAADIGHDDKQEHEDQRNAGIVRNDDDQGDDPEHVERERADGAQRGDAVAVQAHGLGQNDDIGDLADLGGLNIERQEGKVQPAFIAGRALNAPDEQHGQKGGIEQEQQRPLPGEDVDVEGGERQIQQNARDQRARLDDNVAAAVIGRGGRDHHDAEHGGQHAQRQQDHIPLAQDLQQFCPEFSHAVTSRFRSSYSIIDPAFCKPKSMFCKKRADMVK